MKEEIKSVLSLPNVDQVGFLVRDIESSLALYEPLFGPFTRMESPIEGARYRGKEEDCKLTLAFGKSGDLEIELIQWVEGACPHRDFIESGREGMHHLRFRVENVEDKIEEAKALGYTALWYKRMAPTIAFAYLERAGDPLVIEFLEMP